jgi:hypothetical protein
LSEKDSNSHWPLINAWNSSSVNSVSCTSFFASAGGGGDGGMLAPADARDRRDEPWRDGVQFGAMAEITTAMGARKAGGLSRRKRRR